MVRESYQKALETLHARETRLDFSLKPRIQPAASYALARPWKRDLLAGSAAKYDGSVLPGGVGSSFSGESEAYGK
jgi:hypothetical protein